jgi:hypothetical protein
MGVHCALYYHNGRFILVILHHFQGLAQFQRPLANVGMPQSGVC